MANSAHAARDLSVDSLTGSGLFIGDKRLLFLDNLCLIMWPSQRDRLRGRRYEEKRR
jgi:hypothetical protein